MKYQEMIEVLRLSAQYGNDQQWQETLSMVGAELNRKPGDGDSDPVKILDMGDWRITAREAREVDLAISAVNSAAFRVDNVQGLRGIAKERIRPVERSLNAVGCALVRGVVAYQREHGRS